MKKAKSFVGDAQFWLLESGSHSRNSTRPARSETLVWNKPGAVETKKPHLAMRLSLIWLPLLGLNAGG
ncbi:hypothetical protein IX91_01685 [Vibrio tubiashii ATCC 19109]|uniref:Uncharacterized protein n=1 Tax=Vibrio tubiashii ATCC 19109 TaxID=1051646 RepID=F9SZE4_9VIBR|nr:hypothetical protein IX91_01685 [Vibrio tubiashii ATCC 19109]EGU59124.1 hypothetical protein VITU9109_25365 [Vibrio tubiashii ATCC 19109]EIF01352.1 hypothetical protein VT1337_24018 [Vibrio tubiashii NCIMB 1337 = ATCC 19106]